ncbi:piggyBac transposable element-derived protein 4-like [Palaemon carinicauda]|uniref:piggyBac transposable element-derived protein 4-like n=1 Tax=Palaemon carinicauda TaxID=392227 RepID=UPI0035B5780F
MSKKKTLTDDELEHMMNATGALSNLDEDEEAVDNEGLGTNIHDDEMTASDEEVEDQDQIELELMYDSDYDKDYVPSCSDSESSDNVEGSEDAEKRPKKKKETTRKTRSTSTPKKKTRIVGPNPGIYPVDSTSSTLVDIPSPSSPIAGPSNDVSIAANSSSAAPSTPAASGRGRRRRQAEVDVPVPPIVSFDTATLDAKHGFRWCTRPQSSTNRVARNIVAGRPGPNAEAQACHSPEECFNLFLDDSFLDIVCQWTNKRMEIVASKYKKKTSTHKNVEREELRAFIGVLIFSGCQKDSHMSTCDMWSVDIGAALYRAAMSQARFEFILDCLRFDDPQTREMRIETDRFAPIRELFDKFMEKCERHYTPCENLCVDEQLVGFRGKCSFRMYIPSKLAKYGIKLVNINDCKSKYLLGSIPYLGKDNIRPSAGVGLGHYYTKELTKPYHMTNRNVTTDNWFTSVGLVADLLQNCGMTLVGTVKANKRELPEKIKTKDNREPGSSAFLFTIEMTLVSYVPPVGKTAKKLVLLLSSMHSQPVLQENGKPEIIEFYNRTKGGVDAFDGMCALYSCNRKTKRWPLCIFYWMVNAAIINAKVLYTAHLETTGVTKFPERRRFMLRLARSFIRPWAEKRLSSATLPRNLRTLITTVCNTSSVVNTQYPTGQVLAQCNYPQVRCAECPRS